MHTKLYFIRKSKALFSKFKLHILVKPFEGFLFNLLYLSRLSRWINQNKRLPFNDFYNRSVNYEDRFLLHDYVISTELEDLAFDYLEFGVARGSAFKWWVNKIKNSDCRFYGFDVFTGLPEKFGVMTKEFYNTKGAAPDIDDPRVKFISGLFQDSLPDFLKTYHSTKRKVIHMDADLYSSTLFVITQLYPFLESNDIIIFDEFGVPTHEFRAFEDIFNAFKIKYDIIGAVNNYLQLAIKLK